MLLRTLKIGLEVESYGHCFNDPDGKADDVLKDLYDPKGKILYVFRQDTKGNLNRDTALELSDKNSHLVATAERGAGKSSIRTEFIYGGDIDQPLSPGGERSKKVAQRIQQWIKLWSSIPREEWNTIYVQPGFTDTPSQTSHFPIYRLNKCDTDPTVISQITIGMPLAGFDRIVKEEQLYRHFFASEAPSVNERRREEAQCITQKFVSWTGKQRGWVGNGYTQKYAQETATGFLCIVQAYVSAAREQNPEGYNRLKLKVPFMPRTDFRTMLHLVCDTMTSTAATTFRKDLATEFFSHDHKPNLKDLKWSFASRKGSQVGEITVEVTKFLKDLETDCGDTSKLTDLITQGDTNSNSQIGALGRKVERFLDSKDDKLLGPILEFRQLEVVVASKLVPMLQNLEMEVAKVHKEVLNSNSA
ncbi:hypothetical protein GLAREA_04190 [Glarea lozoyensis ATCC 20868]|uniref:Uncharacterized protein n=1 Tax=Glarea lozoyensis (strain ATCC 20868 / MF5171) TaxID=1116229 RepID=S3CQL3_GLAL2|nr:uncharacterized protein GLAREA_04190 [Glarea lozoyensis ATCC 20868]EPE27399.1 hypothetical protein GLAREA_04190 [Glarea lozoyensis ATCC 20868]